MISEYMGKSLNSNDDSQIVINPQHPRTKALLEWYKYLKDPSTLEHVTHNSEGKDNMQAVMAASLKNDAQGSN